MALFHNEESDTYADNFREKYDLHEPALYDEAIDMADCIIGLDLSDTEEPFRQRNLSHSSTRSSDSGVSIESGSGTLSPGLDNATQVRRKKPNTGRYKTEACRSFLETGECRYGNKCQFAHGDQEVRRLPRHPKYKSEYCRTFHTSGFCPYGKRCHFVHNESEEQVKKLRQNCQGRTAAGSLAAIRIRNQASPVIGTYYVAARPILSATSALANVIIPVPVATLLQSVPF